MKSINGARAIFASGAKHFGLPNEILFESGTFACGETNVKFNESVRGEHVIIVQSFHNADTNNQLMELLLLIDAAKRADADEVTVIFPYFPYGRQDRKPDAGTPISARVICDLLHAVNIDRLVAIDLHATQIQGFMSNDVQFDHVSSSAFLAYHLNVVLSDVQNLVVCSPDGGGVKRAKKLASLMGISEFCMIDKTRSAPGEISDMSVIGDVHNKSVLIIDDMIDTAGTLVAAKDTLYSAGAADVMVAATHGVCTNPAFARLKDMRAFLSDSIRIDGAPENITIFSMHCFLYDLINKIKNKKKISELFKKWEE